MAEPIRRIRLALLFGGRSAEHDVSVTSARSVREALDPARFEVVPLAIGRDGQWLPPHASRALFAPNESQHPAEAVVPTTAGQVPAAQLSTAVDVVFPLLHGPYGEDGTVQGMLELLDVPYIGAGVAASAVGMDKVLMKALFTQYGLPILPFSAIQTKQWQRERELVVQRLRATPGLPCFVKPANMGSSIGISKVEHPEALAPALDVAFSYDRKVLVERGVLGYREVECAVLGNDDPQVSVPGEIVVHGGFYDYDTKYTDGAADLVVPAPVRPETARALQALSVRAFQAIDAAGMARVDFLVSPDESEIWVSEINTIPGFTPLSMYPQLWQASGISYSALIVRLVDLALERHDDRARLRVDRTAAPQE